MLDIDPLHYPTIGRSFQYRPPAKIVLETCEVVSTDIDESPALPIHTTSGTQHTYFSVYAWNHFISTGRIVL